MALNPITIFAGVPACPGLSKYLCKIESANDLTRITREKLLAMLIVSSFQGAET